MRLFKRQENHNLEYNLVKNSKYFDAQWYLKMYLDVAAAKADPVKHYLDFGWKEGRNPSQKFNTDFYLSEYKPKNMCPLVHYEKYGQKLNITVVDSAKKKDPIYIQPDVKNGPVFSVIVSTYNRNDLLIKTIHSILGQTYQHFEIIIVDDGSTDDTKKSVYAHFPVEIKDKKIRYFYKKHSGVSSARNYGIKHAKNEWIAFVDSDNLLLPDFFRVFAQNIIKYGKKYKTFYCDLNTFSGKTKSHEFDYKKLTLSNYIDLGVFVFKNIVYKKLGGFDENMTRLVDWDLILRYTKKFPPKHINEVCLFYNDINDHPRITNSEDSNKNLEILRKKRF